MDRRGFFRRISGKRAAIRPPGALSEIEFGDRCDGCKDCVKACPEKIISITEHNLPQLSFNNNGCTFCGECISACDRGALIANDNLESSWPWVAEISDDCLDKKGVVCRTCEFSCDEEAIRFRPALGGRTDVWINENCTGCGICISSCHASAIALVAGTSIQFKSKENAA